MALHFLPDSDLLPDIQEEIRLLPSDPRPAPPRLTDWLAEPAGQIITHVATGCQFRAYPVKHPLAEGLVTPFAPSYDVAVKYAGMKNNMPRPDDVRNLGRQGIEWILRFTYESHRRK